MRLRPSVRHPRHHLRLDDQHPWENARLGKGDLRLENGEVLRKAVAAGEEQEELGGRGELPGEASC